VECWTSDYQTKFIANWITRAGRAAEDALRERRSQIFDGAID
jgi:hypothetical protein